MLGLLRVACSIVPAWRRPSSVIEVRLIVREWYLRRRPTFRWRPRARERRESMKRIARRETDDRPEMDEATLSRVLLRGLRPFCGRGDRGRIARRYAEIYHRGSHGRNDISDVPPQRAFYEGRILAFGTFERTRTALLIWRRGQSGFRYERHAIKHFLLLFSLSLKF